LASSALLAVTTPCHAQRRLDRRARRAFVAADQLDEQVDIGRFRQFDRIVEPSEAAQRDAAVLALVAGADAGDDDGAPRAPLKRLRLTLQQANDGGANGAEAGNADAQGSGRNHGATPGKRIAITAAASGAPTRARFA
jgi:hypothetical protein